jgi:tRNA(fMet)-specific endonuclease VapC
VGVLIDASVLIHHERVRGEVGSFRERRDELFFLSVITVSELLHGVHRAADPAQRARRSAFVETVLEEFPVLGVDLLTARTHAELSAELARRGQPIGVHDLWLAATCVGRGLALMTRNAREFRGVPALELEVWES